MVFDDKVGLGRILKKNSNISDGGADAVIMKCGTSGDLISCWRSAHRTLSTDGVVLVQVWAIVKLKIAGYQKQYERRELEIFRCGRRRLPVSYWADKANARWWSLSQQGGSSIWILVIFTGERNLLFQYQVIHRRAVKILRGWCLRSLHYVYRRVFFLKNRHIIIRFLLIHQRICSLFLICWTTGLEN